jgi:type II secretory pathway pseudopilin PulG
MRRLRQGGAALLITVMIVIGIAAFGAIVAGSISSSDITDSHYQGAAVEALYAAESGMERAMREYGSGVTACDALAGTHTLAAGRTFTISNGLATDFSGVALPNPNSQCRIRVAGTVANTSERILHAIADKSLLSGLNPTFNTPPGVGNATSWTTTARGQDFTGGPDPGTAAPMACSRAIYSVKARDAGGNVGATLATATLPNMQITGGQTITVRFNYRAIEIDNGDAACSITDGAVANPGNTTDVQIRFSVTDNAAITSFSNTLSFNINTATNSLRPLANRNLTAATACIPTTQRFPGDYAACPSLYQAGTPATKGNLSITILGAGTRTLVAARIYIYLRQQGNAREVWMDNVEFIAPSVTGVTRTSDWRDCAVSSCPNL